MHNVEAVKEAVLDLYEKPNPVIDWNDWVFHNHNEAVAHWVRDLATRYEFDSEAVQIAAYLHDLAYAWTSKNDPTLDEQSNSKAKEILESLDFPEERIALIVDGIIAGHGMHQGQNDKLSVEAKIFSTADALAHFIKPDGQTSDFYIVMCWNHYLFEDKNLSDYKDWVIKKIERDFNTKIYFGDEQELAFPNYDALKRVFGGK